MALPKNVKVFDIRIREVKGEKKPTVVFSKGIEVFLNGDKVDLGQFQGGFLKKKDELVASLQKAVESGKLDSEYADKQIAFLEDKGVSSVYEIYNKN